MHTSDQLVALGELRQRHHRLEVELFDQASLVGTDRLVAEQHQLADVLVLHPTGEVAQDAQFAVAKAVDQHRLRHTGALTLNMPFQARKEALVEHHRLDRQAQFDQLGSLGDITHGTGAHAAFGVELRRLFGEHHQLARQVQVGEPLDRFQAIEPGDIEVHDNQVRRQLPRQLHRIDAVIGLGDDLEALLFQQDLDGHANERVIVNYQGCAHYKSSRSTPATA